MTELDNVARTGLRLLLIVTLVSLAIGAGGTAAAFPSEDVSTADAGPSTADIGDATAGDICSGGGVYVEPDPDSDRFPVYVVC